MPLPEPYDHLFKVLLIGDSGVGKSSLLFRLSDDHFTANHVATIGVDFKIRTMDVEGEKIKLQIWDTAGQERFRTITKTYYRGTHGVVVVYDITNPLTFHSVRQWLYEIDLHCDDIVKMLVGNKSDSRNKKVSTEEGQSLAKQLNISFFETSAKENVNVDEIFDELTNQVMQMKKERQARKNPGAIAGGSVVKIAAPPKKKGTCGCN